MWKSRIRLSTDGGEHETVEKKFSTVQKLSTEEKGQKWKVSLFSYICTGITLTAIFVISNRSQELWS